MFTSKTVSMMLLSLLFLILPIKTYSVSFTEQIQIADEIKSTDFSKFSELVSSLQQNSSQLTPEQLEYVSYLTAYQLAYAGQQVKAFKSLNDLANNASSDVLKLKSTGVIINMLVLSRKYSEVFSYMENFNLLLDKVNDHDAKSLGLAIMALVFNQINQFDIGLHYAENLINFTNNKRYLCTAMQFKLEALYSTRQHSSFDELYQDGVDVCSDAGQPIYSNIIRSFKIKYLIDNNPAEAIMLLDSVFEEVESTSYKILTSSFRALYSSAYLKLGQLALADQFGLSALEQLSPQDINPSVILVYETLYKLSKAKGDHQQALNYYEILVSKQKAYDDEKAAGLLAYNLAKADVEVKNQHIALLDKDNELLSLQRDLYEQEARQNRLLVLILATVLLLASVLAYRGMTGRRRFKKIAEYDQLTGVSNRYHFNNQAQIALEYCDKNAKPAALILFDLDHFKQINDAHGHAAGDWALQAVVKTCRNFMRNNDVFGRIGGEEFAVLLPGCQSDKAALLAEICRDAIASIDCSDSGFDFPLSASFGVSGSDTSGYSLKQLLADADNAMYQAKAAGRDTVISFELESCHYESGAKS